METKIPARSKKNIPFEQWAEYKRSPTIERRNAIAGHYQWLVEITAKNLIKKIDLGFDFHDLVSIGFLGLLGAIEKYDPARKILFTSFSALRIRGEMLDAIRKDDWIPRLVRTRARKLEDARLDLASSLNREPSDLEIANKMGMTMAEYFRFDQKAQVSRFTSLQELVGKPPVYNGNEVDPGFLFGMIQDKKARDPKAIAEGQGDIEFLREFIDEREAELIRLYYEEGRSLASVGTLLGISEARACQLRKRALGRMRKAVKNLTPSLTREAVRS